MNKIKEIEYRLGLIETILEENGFCFKKNGKIIANIRPPIKDEKRGSTEAFGVRQALMNYVPFSLPQSWTSV